MPETQYLFSRSSRTIERDPADYTVPRHVLWKKRHMLVTKESFVKIRAHGGCGRLVRSDRT